MNRPVFSNRWTATLDGEQISYASEPTVRQKLLHLWHAFEACFEESQMAVKEEPTTPYSEASRAAGSKALSVRPDAEIRFEDLVLRDQERDRECWLIGFQKAFLKAVDSIDRKLQGKVLQAITEIVRFPVRGHGDTVKPLTRDRNGWWRYRIGKYRLIYYPDEATRTITLGDFAARGSVYD